MVKLMGRGGGGSASSPRGKHSKFVSWKRNKHPKSSSPSATTAAVFDASGSSGDEEEARQGGSSPRSEGSAGRDDVERQAEEVAAAVVRELADDGKSEASSLGAPVPPPVEISGKSRSRSIKSIISLKSRGRSGASDRSGRLDKLVEESDGTTEAILPSPKAAATTTAVPSAIALPAGEDIIALTRSGRSDRSSKSHGSTTYSGPNSPRKLRYVPLQQRLREREARMAAEREAERMARPGARGAAVGGSDGGDGSDALARDGGGVDGALPTFSELDRMCRPVEEGCGRQCGEGGSDDDFVLEVGDEFVEGKIVAEQESEETARGALWSAAAWLCNDKLCLPVDAFDNLCLGGKPPALEDQETVRSDPPPKEIARDGRDDDAGGAPSPFLGEPTGSVRESPTSAAVFARVATFPPTKEDGERRMTALNKRAEREAARRRGPEAAAEAEARRFEEERAAAAAAEEEAYRMREKAEMKVNAYHEELKWMEANLDYESQQNSALNTQVAQLKQGIITAKAQLKRDVLIAHNEAKRAIEERNEEIKKMEEAVAVLKDNIEQERRLRDEALHGAQADAQNAVEARNEEIAKMDEVIAALRLNIDAERKMRDDAEKVVQDQNREMELINEAQSKTLRGMEASLKEGNLKNLALSAEIEELKSEILVARAKKQSLDEVNACLAEEAQSAKEAAETKIKEQTDALKEMETNWKEESKQNEALKAHIAQLKEDIINARADQDELDKEAERVRDELERKIQAQTEALRKTEANLRSESKHNSALDAKVEQLNKSIAETRAKQGALEDEAGQVKGKAEQRINNQTEVLKKMQVNWNSECKQNNMLISQIASLKKDIAAAKANQQEADQARAQAAEEARKAREEADAKTAKQMEALKKMESNWKSEMLQNSVLNDQMAKLKKSIATTEEENVGASKSAGDLSAQIAKLKSDNERLKKARSVDRRKARKTIDAQNEELRKVEKAIRRLKENVAREYRARDEARESRSGGEAALQRRIDLISEEILVAQRNYAEKLEIVQSMSRSMSMDSTRPRRAAYYDGSAVEVELDDDDEEEDENYANSEGGPSDSEDNSAADDQVDSDMHSFANSAASTRTGGRKVGWFRKLLTATDDATDDDFSVASSVVSDARRSRSVGWLRSKKWRRGSRGDHRGRWTPSSRQDSVFSVDSLEEEDVVIDEDDEEEDEASYADASRSYTISYSESGAGTFESVKAAESDCTSVGEVPPSGEDAAGAGGAVSSSAPVPADSTADSGLPRTSSSGSGGTGMSGSETVGDGTLGETDTEDGSMAMASSAEEARGAPASGVMGWFGIGSKAPNREASLGRVNSGASMLVQ